MIIFIDSQVMQKALPIIKTRAECTVMRQTFRPTLRIVARWIVSACALKHGTHPGANSNLSANKD